MNTVHAAEGNRLLSYVDLQLSPGHLDDCHSINFSFTRVRHEQYLLLSKFLISTLVNCDQRLVKVQVLEVNFP